MKKHNFFQFISHVFFSVITAGWKTDMRRELGLSAVLDSTKPKFQRYWKLTRILVLAFGRTEEEEVSMTCYCIPIVLSLLVKVCRISFTIPLWHLVAIFHPCNERMQQLNICDCVPSDESPSFSQGGGGGWGRGDS